MSKANGAREGGLACRTSYEKTQTGTIVDEYAFLSTSNRVVCKFGARSILLRCEELQRMRCAAVEDIHANIHMYHRRPFKLMYAIALPPIPLVLCSTSSIVLMVQLIERVFLLAFFASLRFSFSSHSCPLVGSNNKMAAKRSNNKRDGDDNEQGDT